MKRVTFILIAIFIVSVVTVNAGDKATINFKGLVQGWFSYAEQPDGEDNSPYGFTLRRLRFAPYGTLSKNIKWGFQVAWDKQNAFMLDAFFDIRLSGGFNIKLGQFAAPGAISGALTSSAKLDFVERAAISQNWGGNAALLGYRAYGIQAHGNLMDKKLYYAIMIGNPRTASLFTPSVKAATYSHDENGINLWARLEAKPFKNLRIGSFYGGGKTDDDYKRNSYGAFLFYVKDAVNFKAEYIAGEHGFEDLETKYNGMYVVLGYRMDKIEPVIRYGFYTPNDGGCDDYGVEKYKDITAGINYYHSKFVKFQANYVARSEDGTSLKNNLFYACFQYSFK
ncbi:MAG: hypothetical protein GY757_57080 [bacterium]|nr:hypothetical protein [bacterium]